MWRGRQGRRIADIPCLVLCAHATRSPSQDLFPDRRGVLVEWLGLRVVTLGWPFWIGIGSRIKSESLTALDRDQWPLYVGMRTRNCCTTICGMSSRSERRPRRGLRDTPGRASWRCREPRQRQPRPGPNRRAGVCSTYPVRTLDDPRPTITCDVERRKWEVIAPDIEPDGAVPLAIAAGEIGLFLPVLCRYDCRGLGGNQEMMIDKLK